MKAYSLDLREKIVETHQTGGITQRELAARFRVSLNFMVKAVNGTTLRASLALNASDGHSAEDYGESMTLMGAIDRNGLVATLIFRGATDTLAMKVFVKEVLLPYLKAGDCVIWDNLSVHKTRAVQELFTESGIELLFLPPYSPDLNLIEMCWSKLKTFLRSVGARTYEKLSEAISVAIKLITSTDAQNWIRHCGNVSHLL